MGDILITKTRTEKHAHMIAGKVVTIEVPRTRVKRIYQNKYTPAYCTAIHQINEHKRKYAGLNPASFRNVGSVDAYELDNLNQGGADGVKT